MSETWQLCPDCGARHIGPCAGFQIVPNVFQTQPHCPNCCVVQPNADNLQRRRYAEAAMAGFVSALKRDGIEYDAAVIAKESFDLADAMLTEQRRRESGE